MPDAKQPLDLSTVVYAICDTNDRLAKQLNRRNEHPLPVHDQLIEIVEQLKAVLFPGYFGRSELSTDNMRFHIGAMLDSIRRDLREQIKRGLCFTCPEKSTDKCPQCERRTQEYTDEFLSRLNRIRHMLGSDVQAAYEGDPAATSPDETIFCYPGVQAITYHRIAHELYRLGVPLIPRIISEHAHSVTGIDIHPGATIGEMFFIDHGTGVVIGETCKIGRNVRLYQGVTLGAKSFPLDKNGNPIKGIARHPIVEDDAIIYSGATILGRVTIGRGSVIGGNVWLTESVPPGSRLTQAHAAEVCFEKGAGI